MQNLSDEPAGRLGHICDRYEEACQRAGAGPLPDIEGFLPTDPALCGDAEPELLRIQLFYRRQTSPVAIPGYEILNEIGHGGMGVVYRARQVGLNRIVALKMILAGAHATPEQLNQFRREAESVARQQHPNIVQIHEIGEQSGLPYFSLEFVEGGSLKERLAGTPVMPRTAAQIVQTLAQAIDYAHGKEIVHRDLKPENILLAGSRHKPLEECTPKIADFGLAKQVDTEGATGTGVIAGTPSYLAPEQAKGLGRQIGPLADVWALGAILYEMLTGRPPFRAATALDTVHQVINDEPVPPSRLQSKTPRDLETICLKCLQKEPSRRYATAEALAEDLQRFLDGRPILARPVGVLERSWRWCGRNKLVAGLIVAVVASLLTGTVVSTIQMLRAQTSEAKAEGRFELAISAVHRMTTRIAEGELRSIRDLEQTRLKLLQDAKALYQELLETGSSLALRHELGRTHGRLGDIYTRLGKAAEAEMHYVEGITWLSKSVVEAQEEPTCWRDLALIHSSFASLLLSRGRTTEALENYGASLRIRETLIRDYPDNDQYFADCAASYNDLALFHADRGDREQALLYYGKALSTWGKVADPDERQLLNKAICYNNLGTLYHAIRNDKEAESAYLRALDLVRGLSTDSPEFLRWHGAIPNNLGYLYLQSRRLDDANKRLAEALAVRKRLADEHPDVSEYKNDLACTYNNLGLLYHAERKPDEARKAYEAVLKIRRALVASAPGITQFQIDLGATYGNLGRLMRDYGRNKAEVESALNWYEEAQKTLELLEAHAEARECLCKLHWGVAQTFMKLDRPEAALERWKVALSFDDRLDVSRSEQLRLGEIRTLVSLVRQGLEQDCAWPLLWGWPRF